MESAPGPSSNFIIMEEYRTKERSNNFSKGEICRLQKLVDKYKTTLMCKKTDGTSAKQKDHAWRCIETEFNAVGQTPRTMKQLKYKFENMKRSAKKEACKERQEMRRTGGGKLPSLPPGSEDATDWLRLIMSGSIDGNEAVYDDDVISQPSVNILKNNKEIIRTLDFDGIPSEQKKLKQDINCIDGLHEIHSMPKDVEISTFTLDQNESVDDIAQEEAALSFDASTPHSSLKRPVAPPLKRMIGKRQGKASENIIKRALREKKLSVLDGLHDLEMEKIKQSISQQRELHEQKTKHNEEKHKLELLKLELEIDILQHQKSKENKERFV